MEPAVEQNQSYQAAYDHLNEKLFKGVLTTPMLIFSQNKHVKRGMFKPQKWEQDETGGTVHEIAIGINKLAERDIVGVFVVLLEQMTHQLQYEGTAGQYSRDGRCNKQWLGLVKAIGLTPETLTPGYGIKCTLALGGRAEEAITTVPSKALFPWMNLFEGDVTPKYSGGKRTKYKCGVCSNVVWGRKGLVIYCRGSRGAKHDAAEIETCIMEVQ